MNLSNNQENSKTREIDLVDEIIHECNERRDLSVLADLRVSLFTVLDYKISVTLTRLKEKTDSCFSRLAEADNMDEVNQICEEIARLALLIKEILNSRHSSLNSMIWIVNEIAEDFERECLIIKDQIRRGALKLMMFLDYFDFSPVKEVDNKIADLEKSVKKVIYLAAESRYEAAKMYEMYAEPPLEGMKCADDLGRQKENFIRLVNTIHIILDAVLDEGRINIASVILNNRSFCEITDIGGELYEKADRMFAEYLNLNDV